jgi:hypothetical protein
LLLDRQQPGMIANPAIERALAQSFHGQPVLLATLFDEPLGKT